MSVSMLDLSGMHTAIPLSFRKRKFGHAVWIDTPAGGNFFDAARQRKRNLSRYRLTNLGRSVRDRWGIGQKWREGGAHGGYGA